MKKDTSTGNKALKQNPELKPFDILVGEWKTEGKHPVFPGTILHGHVSFKWIEGGAFLIMHSHIDHEKFPDGIAIFEVMIHSKSILCSTLTRGEFQGSRMFHSKIIF